MHGDGTCAWLTIWYCKHEEYWLVCVYIYKQYCGVDMVGNLISQGNVGKSTQLDFVFLGSFMNIKN